MPQLLNYYLQISLSNRLIAYCTLLFLKTYSNLPSILGKAPKNIVFFSPSTQNLLKYTLQAYYQKHSIYSQVLKSSLNFQKSTQKHLKALAKHPLHLLFSILTELFLAFFNTATTLLAQFHIY
jgi:hypothetical protein